MLFSDVREFILCRHGIHSFLEQEISPSVDGKPLLQQHLLLFVQGFHGYDAVEGKMGISWNILDDPGNMNTVPVFIDDRFTERVFTTEKPAGG